MPRNPSTGLFTRVSNSYSDPVVGTVIDQDDAITLYNDYDAGLTNTIAIGASQTILPGDQSQILTNLGFTATGKDLAKAANAAAGRTVLGATSVGSDVFTAANSGAALTSLGGTTVGKALFTAADAAAGRTAIAAAGTGANNTFTGTNAFNDDVTVATGKSIIVNSSNNGRWNFKSGATVTVANGAFFDLGDRSGLILVGEISNALAAVFLVSGGTVLKVAGDSTWTVNAAGVAGTCSMCFLTGPARYALQNYLGVTATFSMMNWQLWGAN